MNRLMLAVSCLAIGILSDRAWIHWAGERAKAEMIPKEPQAQVVPSVRAKLHNIVMPVIDFESITQEEAVDFMRARTNELCEREAHAKPINFIILNPDGLFYRVQELRLKDTPTDEVCERIAQVMNVQVRFEENAVVFDAVRPISTIRPLKSKSGQEFLGQDH